MLAYLFASTLCLPPRPQIRKEGTPIVAQVRPLSAPQNDNGFACEMCQMLIAQIESFLEDGKTQEQITKLLVEKVCPLLPNEYKLLCSTMAGQFVPMIVQFIEQKIAAFDICTRIGLCEKAQVRAFSAPKDGFACEMCQMLIAQIDQFLEDGKTQEEITKLLVEKVCPLLPNEYKLLCSTMAGQFVPMIVQWIEKEIAAFDICTRIGLCEKTQVRGLAIPKGDDGFACGMCQKLIDMVNAYLEDGKTQEQIKVLVETKVCPLLPDTYKVLCTTLASTYIPMIIQMIEQKILAFNICARIGLCGEKALRVPQAQKENGFVCTMCQELVRMIDIYLEDGKTEAEIGQLAQKLCDKIPAPYGAICDSLVAQYLPTIIHSLVQKLDPLTICATIRLCTKTVEAVRVPAQEKENGFVCTMCQELVRMIDIYLEDGKTEAEIGQLAQKLCDKIPAPYGAICDSLVAQYLPTIIHSLVQKLDPLTICATIRLCTKTVVNSRVVYTEEQNTFICTMCKEVMRMVEDYIDDGKTQEEIVVLITKYCDKIPAPYGAICDSLVAQYMPFVFQWIHEKLDPETICTKITLCKPEQKTVARLPKTIFETDGISCEICQDFINWAKKEINEYSVPALWKLVSVACPKVARLSKFCRLITENDIQTILNLILSKLQPKEVCEWMKFC